MKSIKIVKSLVCASALSLAFASCSEDRLEPYVPGVLTADVAITKSSDLQNLLNSSYGLLLRRDESVLTSVFTDEVGIGLANGGQGINTSWIFLMNPQQEFPASMWEHSYIALSRINRVIEFADKIVATSTADENKIKAIKAQALTLRAYCHLRILAYFTTNMKDDNALAGILANKVFLPSENQNKRATNGEFYAFIHKDLDDAITLFGDSGIAFSDINANIFFAKGLKARAYLYKGDNASLVKAKEYAEDVINSSGIVLADKAQYRNLFFSDSQPTKTEVIFKLKRTAAQNTQGSNLHNGWASTLPVANGSVFYEVGRALHNLLNPNNVQGQSIASSIEDVRANVIIGPTSVISTKSLDVYKNDGEDYRKEDVLVVNKHGGASTGTSSWAVTASNGNNNDFKIMRISEMHLIVAEAEAQLNNLAEAAAAVKKVRDARYGAAQTVAYSSKQEALQGILLERRLEFAFEGYRFIDLKRLGAEAGVGVDRHFVDYEAKTSNYPAANPANLPMTSYKWALPIPTSEINVNSAIQQNPGY